MPRIKRVRVSGTPDEQVLETDMMRFLAVIGIVFWIIFALIKSMPFHKPASDSKFKRPLTMAKVASDRPAERMFYTSTYLDPPRERRTDAETESESEELKLKLKKKKKAKVSQAELSHPKGIEIQFHSLADLLNLMGSRRVRLFCLARDAGFNLIFEGMPTGDTVHFSNAKGLPSDLWEIKNGKDHKHFLELISKAYPAIRSFPAKQVLVAFADETLAGNVGETLERLEQKRRNGILSISRKGEVEFLPYDR